MYYVNHFSTCIKIMGNHSKLDLFTDNTLFHFDCCKRHGAMDQNPYSIIGWWGCRRPQRPLRPAPRIGTDGLGQCKMPFMQDSICAQGFLNLIFWGMILGIIVRNQISLSKYSLTCGCESSYPLYLQLGVNFGLFLYLAL